MMGNLELECERLGLTINEHNQLVEAALQVAAAAGGCVIDVYQGAVDIIKNDKSATGAADFLETLGGNDG